MCCIAQYFAKQFASWGLSCRVVSGGGGSGKDEFVWNGLQPFLGLDLPHLFSELVASASSDWFFLAGPPGWVASLIGSMNMW